MFVDPAADKSFRRGLLNELVAPRPIGWISTVNLEGVANLAPFSHFNVVSSSPPAVMFSANTPLDRERKDTVANVLALGEFVVNIASFSLREQMVASSVPVPFGTDEFAVVGLEREPSVHVRPPRVAGTPASLECRLLQVVTIEGRGDGESDSQVVFGRVVGIHMRDELVGPDGRFDTVRAEPVARLGGHRYVSTSKVFELPPAFKARE